MECQGSPACPRCSDCTCLAIRRWRKINLEFEQKATATLVYNLSDGRIPSRYRGDGRNSVECWSKKMQCHWIGNLHEAPEPGTEYPSRQNSLSVRTGPLLWCEYSAMTVLQMSIHISSGHRGCKERKPVEFSSELHTILFKTRYLGRSRNNTEACTISWSTQYQLSDTSHVEITKSHHVESGRHLNN